jgi:hypothetical protein
MSPPYQPALFESSLPKWLACTDELAAGIQHHPRQKALKRAYIDPNPSALVWAMVFDVDRPEAATAWQDAPTECPRPNWVTQNPRNGHAHLGYVLASPVSRTLKARATPQRFLARIQHGLTMAVDADRAYTHRLTKTPDHPTWRTFWERPDPYELGELRDYLGDRLPLRIARLEAVGEGRNVTLFDGLRKWAYRARLGYSDWHLWERACRSHADALNAFASPLTTREAHQVAKSVAKWTWTNITPTAFSKIQAERGSQNGANKKIAAMDFTAEIVRYAR